MPSQSEVGKETIVHLFVGDVEGLPASGLDGRVREVLSDRESEPHEATASTDPWNRTDGDSGTQYILRHPPEGVPLLAV